MASTAHKYFRLRSDLLRSSNLLSLSRRHQNHRFLPAVVIVSKRNMANSKNVNFDLDILQNVYHLISQEKLLSGHYDRDNKVIDFVQPEELGQRLGGLEITSDGSTEEDAQALLKLVVQYSVKTCHSRFFNQLYHGSDPVGLAGQWLSDALNTNNHTYEVAPVFILVERALIKYTIDKLGWNLGDGITAPGGSLANMYGLMLARHQLLPELKTTGLCGLQKPLVIFSSEDSHYSVLKGANWLGIGTDNVVKVKTDQSGCMIPQALEEAIKKVEEEGKVPLAVNATSGTTVLGAYDDLAAIGKICHDAKVWLHVDACWGGSVILNSELKRTWMEGLEFVDSLAWNPHKMIGAPLQSNVFVAQKPGLLAECNKSSAGYLFQPDKFYDVSYDTGDKSVQCGRKVDAFQVWFMLKVRGENYFAEAVQNAFDQAEYLAASIRNRPGFELVVDPISCTNVCFHYIPLRMRSIQQQDRNDAFWKEVSTIPPKIKKAMTLDGTLLIGYQPLAYKKLGNFFRMVVHGVPRPSNQDMDFVLDEIEKHGSAL